MIEAKRLFRHLYVADMAVCCDLCGKDTWTCDLEENDIFVMHRWHDTGCPLYEREDVFQDWKSEEHQSAESWRGKLYISLLEVGSSRVHTTWLELRDGSRWRLVPLRECGLEDIDPCLIEGREVDVIGCKVNNETIYYSMLMSRF